MIYEKRSLPGAPGGVEGFLRECFRLQRENGGKGINVLLTGPPGTGKTEGTKAFAQDAGLPFWKVPGENIDPKVLLGRTVLIPDLDHPGSSRTVFVEGIIPRAVRNGGVLDLDEVNAYPQDVQIRLNELLDDGRTLTMQEELDADGNPIVIKAHPELFIIGTQNPPTGANEATNQLIPQLKSRFTKNLWMPAPSKSEQVEFVRTRFGLDKQQIETIRPQIETTMEIANGLRDLEAKGRIDYSPTIREVFTVANDLLHGVQYK
ncbi:MAG: AAA family ATPase, partial [Rhabdochlamydiaceae bacterium]